MNLEIITNNLGNKINDFITFIRTTIDIHKIHNLHIMIILIAALILMKVKYGIKNYQMFILLFFIVGFTIVNILK